MDHLLPRHVDEIARFQDRQDLGEFFAAIHGFRHVEIVEQRLRTRRTMLLAQCQQRVAEELRHRIAVAAVQRQAAGPGIIIDFDEVAEKRQPFLQIGGKARFILQGFVRNVQIKRLDGGSDRWLGRREPLLSLLAFTEELLQEIEHARPQASNGTTAEPSAAAACRQCRGKQGKAKRQVSACPREKGV
ncbi:hypothetical protein RHSP_72831 [Rhizobium freirei PRF 81]|uniref:Uncharacterized protein n=1 Tax=Rhizobium freirei PRF 81 TaxID=363754 RepID=N6U2F0_9HYPH|nr:hypothetical protein RHSP_72831 [Rhizobium freirei PRF 81]